MAGTGGAALTVAGTGAAALAVAGTGAPVAGTGAFQIECRSVASARIASRWAVKVGGCGGAERW